MTQVPREGINFNRRKQKCSKKTRVVAGGGPTTPAAKNTLNMSTVQLPQLSIQAELHIYPSSQKPLYPQSSLAPETNMGLSENVGNPQENPWVIMYPWSNGHTN